MDQAAVNRAGLNDSLLAWLHRAAIRAPSGSFDAVANWITLGEGDINLDLRARCMVARATQAVDGQYVPLPCDWLETIDVRIAAPPDPAPVPSYVGRELQYQPRRELGDRYAWNGGGVYALDPRRSAFDDCGGPRYFAVVGDQMEVWPIALPPSTPAPDGWNPYYIEMSYYARQTLGPDPADTTAALTVYPGAYIFGALRHATPFLRDAERVALFQQNYESAIFRANAEHERRSQGSRLVARYRRPA